MKIKIQTLVKEEMKSRYKYQMKFRYKFKKNQIYALTQLK